jgi:hypothetical protein
MTADPGPPRRARRPEPAVTVAFPDRPSRTAARRCLTMTDRAETRRRAKRAGTGTGAQTFMAAEPTHRLPRIARGDSTRVYCRSESLKWPQILEG